MWLAVWDTQDLRGGVTLAALLMHLSVSHVSQIALPATVMRSAAAVYSSHT